MENQTKKISMEEILRQQLELLAERSNTCTDEELPAITMAMVEIYKAFYLL